MKKTFVKQTVVWVLLLALVFALCACNPDKGPSGDDFYDLSVRDATGTHGAVASANAYASKAGYDILQNGGNAFDASVAIAFAIGVTEPYASGIGGGGVMTAYNAKTHEYVFYNFREFLSGTSTQEAYRGVGLSAIPTTGIYSVGVPTEVAGLTAIVEDFGNLTLEKVMEPAIDLAENGFVVAKTMADNINLESFRANGTTEALKIFSYEGNELDPLREGDVLVQKDYAKVLKEIAANGAPGFYTGWVANAIVKASQDNGGFITQQDLAYAMNNYPKKGKPLHTNYNGYDIYTANTPSSGGIILTEALNMLSHWSEKNGKTLESLGHNSPEYLHLVATALQLSFGDKRHYIADNSVNPATGEPFVNVPIEGLSSKEYAAQRFDYFYKPDDTVRLTSSYDWGGASGDKAPTEFQSNTAGLNYGITEWEDDNGTTAFSVADSEGNIVSYTQTINHFWGSYIIPEGCGFFLNDQLTSFSFTNGSVHYVAPYKQPVSHIMPTIILKDGKPFATLGSPGSMRIPSAVTQVVLNLIDFHMDMQSAINAERIHSYCVQTADSSSMSDGHTYSDRKLIYCEHMSQATMDALNAINYYVAADYHDELNNFFGGVQGITFTWDGDKVTLHGGADPRRDGKALAF